MCLAPCRHPSEFIFIPILINFCNNIPADNGDEKDEC